MQAMHPSGQNDSGGQFFHDYQIIYILGGGHSGSTLLDLIISTAAEVYSVGELAFLDQYMGHSPPSFKLSIGRICSCGKHMDNCPFWKSLCIEDHQNILKIESFWDSFKMLINILNPFEAYLCYKIGVGANRQIYDKIYQAAKTIKPKLKYILDSSKNPRRLYELIKDNNLPVKSIQVIHLVRDGRGYIHSNRSVKRKRQGLKVRSIPYYLFEWLLINILSRIMIRKYRLNTLHISYDLFCRKPKVFISELNRWLQISIANFPDVINGATIHNIHGNLMRFRKFEGIVHDKPWEEWESKLKKWSLSLILRPFNQSWVYKNNP